MRGGQLQLDDWGNKRVDLRGVRRRKVVKCCFERM
jgi:hypothetical protein